MGLSLTSAPALEPVTLAEAKAHLRITHADENTELERFIIPTARALAEAVTHRALITQTWALKLLSFGSEPIRLPRPPLSSITSIQYVDENGTTQTWSSGSYDVETPSGDHALHGSVRPAYTEVYPTTRGVVDAVTITFVAGYGATRASVPVALRQAILILCEDLYAHRSSQVMGQGVGLQLSSAPAEALLAPYIADRRDLRFD